MMFKIMHIAEELTSFVGSRRMTQMKSQHYVQNHTSHLHQQQLKGECSIASHSIILIIQSQLLISCIYTKIGVHQCRWNTHNT